MEGAGESKGLLNGWNSEGGKKPGLRVIEFGISVFCHLI